MVGERWRARARRQAGAGPSGCAALTLVALLAAACLHQVPLEWSLAHRELPESVGDLAQLRPGDDVIVRFKDPGRLELRLRFERLELPFLIGAEPRRGESPGERIFEPKRIDLREVQALSEVRVNGIVTVVTSVAVLAVAFVGLFVVLQNTLFRGGTP